MVGPERTYQIGFAVASLDGLFRAPLREALLASWHPSTTITRYGRRWHLARIHADMGYAIVGRIGFVSDTDVTTLFFDSEVGDFVTGAAPSGVIVPFAIRLSDGG